MMNASSATRSLLAVFVAFFVVALLPLKCADRANEDRQASAVVGHQPPASVIHDWSTNRVIYPDTLPPGQYSRLANDPRYVNQSRIRRAQRAAAFNQQAGGARFSASDRGSFEAQDRAGAVAQIQTRRHDTLGQAIERPEPALRVDWSVSLGGGGVYEGVSPAKYTYDAMATPSCTADFVVFPISASPSSDQANIIAFNALYKAPAGLPTGLCGNGDPNTYWAYRIGDGPIRSSPVPSLDGTKIVFVEAGTSGAVLHVLRWKSNQGTGPTGPVAPDETVTWSLGSGSLTCLGSGSCDIAIPYTQQSTSTQKGNTRSFPYVDYAGNGTAWVGADDGYLYRIRNVFTAPAFDFDNDRIKIAAGDAKMTSPSYDPLGDRVVVSDGSQVYAVVLGLKTVSPLALGVGEIYDGPMLDLRPDEKAPGTGYTVAWLFGSGSTSIAPSIAQVVYKWPTFSYETTRTDPIGASNGAPVRSGILTAGVYLPTYGGQGFMFVCGNQGLSGGNVNLPQIYRYDIEGNGKVKTNPSPKSSAIATTSGRCSPLAYSYVPTYDANAVEYLFIGHISTSDPANSSNVQQWNVKGTFSNQTWAVARTENGGTSGIIIDNLIFAASQSANIYFGTLGTNMAVKLTQSALQ